MRKILIFILSVFIGINSEAQTKLRFIPYFQQSGMYYSSNHVTSAGYGLGTGLAINYGKHLTAQTDMNIYWLNGNALSSRLAVGYKKDGKWSPAIYGFFSLIFGSHTEVLYEDGKRPEMPVAVVGVRIAPLRFENDKGFVSILEYNYGISRNKGRINELSLVALGIRF
ncbi:MAG: hypothetical protein U0W24_12475 [Bacteroidales bacterium]